jgi:hypothetical protein
LEQGISKLSLDNGNKLKEVMEAYQGGSLVCVDGKKKKERRKCEECFLVFMCARIKHGKDVCKNQAWKNCV